MPKQIKINTLRDTYTQAIKHAQTNRTRKLTQYEQTHKDHYLASVMRDDRKIALLNYVLSVNTNISGRKI
jgi:hypothetical protein